MKEPGGRGSPLIGRERELEQVRFALRGGGGVVIVGEAGVGKSRLARAAAEVAADDGAAIEHVLATSAASVIPFGALASLLPAEVRSGDDPLATMRRTADALTASHQGRGVTLVVDDAQRLDPASAARAPAVLGGHAALLATVRTGEATPDAITALWKDAGALRMDLGALSPPDSALLAEGLLGGPVERRTLDWLVDRSRGNPLYLQELVLAATSGGGLVRERGRRRRESSPPPSARLLELIDGRIGDLDDAQRRALALVALAEPVGIDALTQLVDVGVLEAIESRGLIVAVDGRGGALVRAGHPLYGEAMRARLGIARLRSLRGELTAVLDRDMAAARMLLARWALEDRREPDLGLLVAATADALAAFDPELAVDLGRAAMQAGAGRATALGLGAALRATGRFEEAEAVLDGVEALIVGDPDMRGYLFTRVAGLHFGLGRSEQALALLQRAEAWALDRRWITEVQSMTATVLFSSGRLHEGVELAESLLEAEDVAPQARLTAGWLLGAGLPWLGRPREGIAALARARELAGPGVEPEWPESLTATNGVICLGEGWEAARRALLTEHAAAIAVGDEQRATYMEIGLMDLASVQGDMVALRRWAEDALARLSEADPTGLTPFCLVEVVHSAAVTGEVTDAQEAFAAARDLAARRPPLPASCYRMGIAGAWAAAAEERLEEAQRLALHTAESGGDAGVAILQEAAALYLYLRLGGAPNAVCERLDAIAAQARPSIADHWAGHARAMRSGRAADLDAVAGAWEAIGARLWAAEAYAQAASAHARQGRMSSSRRADAHARRLAESCGVTRTPLLGLARGPALSPREREVAALVARGQSNVEIATELGVSVRTVESHVYHATTKLGVRSRGELAAQLDAERQEPSATVT